MAAVILLVVVCIVWLKSVIFVMWSLVRAAISALRSATERWRERACVTTTLETGA